MRKRSLLAIAVLAWVGPATAHGPGSSWISRNDAGCPNARAQAARQADPGDVPGEGSVFAMGRSSVLMP